MNNIINYIKSICSSQEKHEYRLADPDRKAKTRCPASSLCLGCDGAINCSLARLAVMPTVEIKHDAGYENYRY